jgi:hypothetical protein
MKKTLNFIFCTFCLSAIAQIGPYSWQDHSSLNTSCNTLARFNGKVYASNYSGLVKIDEDEGSAQKLNKINGLNDVGIHLLRVNPFTNKLLVIYDNSNIDIIDANNTIQNYPDIKLKAINGKKGVNEIFFKDKYAYLATGLGIILFDTEKLEIKDTYVIGPNGTNLEITQIALNDSLIFAATKNGLYQSNYKLKILNDYKNWQLVNGLPADIYSGVINVAGKILAAFSPTPADPAQPYVDSLFILDNNNAWSNFYTPNSQIFINKLSYVNGTSFCFFGIFGPAVTDVNTKATSAYITSFNGKSIDPKDLVFFKDKSGNLSYWVADNRVGLFQTYGSNPYFTQNSKSINGINKNLISNIDVFDGKVAISPSYPDPGGGTQYVTEGINVYKDNNWSYFGAIDPSINAGYFDINFVYFDRKDPSRIWASTWFNGLHEYKDQQLVKIYDHSNTSMGEVTPGTTRCAGLNMDSDGNLWIANSDTREYISVRKKDGTFISFDFQVPRFTRKIFVDKNNYVWALHERELGITVFNHNNFSVPIENSNYRILTKDPNSGNLESSAVFSIAEDKDGKIWVGTGAGIRVFYNPTNMFSGANYDAQPIKIVQDGNVELLLEKETVTAIVVDGANNKWVGTQAGGLHCFSPDGIQQLYHFTKETSPLYSNNIIDLNYNKVTGDIFMATELGLQSFRSSIIDGADSYNDIYAYPNPVKPNYTGNVFVRGLLDNSVVKITDESGNLVWETKSQGGQIEWPVKNLSGSRAATGVYVVYAATTTGEIKALTKVLVVN